MDVRAQAVVVGATEVIARSMPSAAGQGGGEVDPGPELVPAQAVEDQEDHLIGAADDGR